MAADSVFLAIIQSLGMLLKLVAVLLKIPLNTENHPGNFNAQVPAHPNSVSILDDKAWDLVLFDAFCMAPLSGHIEKHTYPVSYRLTQTDFQKEQLGIGTVVYRCVRRMW